MKMLLTWTVIALAGCGEVGVTTSDLAVSSDLASPDLAAPDLAPWCVASGATPTCGGQACAPGCWCEYAPNVDAGTDAVACNCGKPAPSGPDTGPGSGILCCGGVYCPFSKGVFLSCDNDDCHL